MPLLWHGEFKSCDLLIAAPLTKEERRALHPACQCMSFPQLVPGTTGIARGGGLITPTATATICGKKRLIPWWVARSKLTAATLQTDVGEASLLSVCPRFQSAQGSHFFHRACCVPSRATCWRLIWVVYLLPAHLGEPSPAF